LRLYHQRPPMPFHAHRKLYIQEGWVPVSQEKIQQQPHFQSPVCEQL
jgi:hypothetical protein